MRQLTGEGWLQRESLDFFSALRVSNLMTKTLPLPRQEVLYRDGGTPRAGKLAIGRPEQKKESWRVDLVRKFSRREDFVIDFYACTCSRAKA